MLRIKIMFLYYSFSQQRHMVRRFFLWLIVVRNTLRFRRFFLTLLFFGIFLAILWSRIHQHVASTFKNISRTITARNIFRTILNICDGAVLLKHLLRLKAVNYFFKKAHRISLLLAWHTVITHNLAFNYFQFRNY